MTAHKRVNIKQVAEYANVSVATISRYIHSPHFLADETRKRVGKAIDELGYHPNVQARNLRREKSQLIIALVPDIANPFFSEVIHGIEQIARDHHYSVLLGNTLNDERLESVYASYVSTRTVDGLITLLPRIPKLGTQVRSPVVNACEYTNDKSVTSVHVDNARAARSATEYLIALGHRRIAHVSGPPTSPISVDREVGYRAALEEGGIKVDPLLIEVGDYSIESGIRAAERLFACKAPFTAIFCANDEMAFGAMNSIIGRGLTIPGDISVVGFDDIHPSRYFIPALTTVSQPMLDIGREAARLLLELLTNSSAPIQHRVLPTQLVVRGSTGPLRSPNTRARPRT